MTRMTKPQPEMLRANISTQQQEDQMEIGEGLSAQIVENSKVWPAHTNQRVKKQQPVETGVRAACVETSWDEYSCCE